MLYGRPYTYIAADWDGDSAAVTALKNWNNSKTKALSFKDAHDLKQARDGSLNCSIKRSLSDRLNQSYKFVLIVGEGTKNVRSGACHLCASYNSYGKYCARGYSVDSRSYIDFECDKAVDDNLEIVVLYNSASVDKSKCPEAIKRKGTHAAMWKRVGDKNYWDYDKIAAAIG